MRILRTLAVLILVAGAFAGGYIYKAVRGGKSAAAPSSGRKILYWVDPMHPAYKSDKPGIAPDCGMQLEPVYADGGAAAQAPEKRKVLYYRDPKNPAYQSPQPGLNPETGNELEPVYEGDAASMPPGAIQVSPEKQQLIGVKYGQAEVTAGASRTIRAAAKVAVDESRIEHVHTKVEGWIEKVYADFTGQFIRKGQPLATIYSPEMLASQREYLLAAKAKDVMSRSALPSALDNSATLLEAARRRLELWDLSDAQIDQVAKTGQPVKNITIFSPASGYITDRKAFPNVKVMPDTDLYVIADLSRVWVVADVFESDAANVRAGQSARVSAAGRSFTAKVSNILPQMDPATHTLKVRLEVPNPGLALKPEMYVDVEFYIAFPARLTVPAEAVLDAGDRKTVFVDRGNGFFEPRRVETGEPEGDRIAILKGLKAGERVVTSGNFLIDSESQLKAAAEGMK